MAIHFGFAKVRDRERVTRDPHNPDRWHPVADASDEGRELARTREQSPSALELHGEYEGAEA